MRAVTAFVLAGTLVLAACGDDPQPEPTPTRPSPERPTAEAPPPADSPAAERDPAERDPAERPAPPTTARTDAETVTADRRLYTVQVAAFTNAESARLWTGRLTGQGLPVWTSVTEYQGQTYHRVRVGAVPTVAEARRLGDMLSQRYEWPVWVAPLTPADQVPADAVQRTRSILNSQ